MTTRSICFRFDVDTPSCLLYGMPALLDLAVEQNVRFTFYVNPGRAVLRTPSPKQPNQLPPATKLSPLRKLGWREYARVAICNPALCSIDKAGVVARAAAEGHEIGLHGGRNHAEWQRYAHTWHESKTRTEIEYGLDALRCMGGLSIRSFASPGWNTPPSLARILPEFGINVLADVHGPDITSPVHTSAVEAIQVPTVFTGEPRGIGYLEWLTAQGIEHTQASSHLIQQLKSKPHAFSVLYDHPCFAGVEAFPLLRRMLIDCKEFGANVTTLASILNTPS